MLSRNLSKFARAGLIRPATTTTHTRLFSVSARRLAEVEITIDGHKVSVEAGSALIQACEKAGVTVPRYCYHDKLAIAGNCRMCLVDVERAPKPVASCAYPVAPGMVVRTDTERVKQARENVMEMMLQNHPLDCPVCDQGGECDLQDQSMRYGRDRGRFTEITGKRSTEDKNIGPLVKTSMNRCIHCTRCIRFANDVAGAPELGSSGRGNDMQIGTYLEKNLNTELSGNVIDLCPVGALTNKPYAFRARPWELKKTESIDVMDGVGSNIRVDSKGVEVMRIIPRIHEEVNEEWINDKSRFACDGLKTQRLTTPLIRVGDKFVNATWDDALSTIAKAYQQKAPKGDEFKAVAGALVEVESMVALKDMTNALGSENTTTDTPNGNSAPAHGVTFRSNYLFNSSIAGIEDADAILLVGTNPRREAAVMNARIRKAWLRQELDIASVGPSLDATFDLTELGNTHADLENALSGEFGETLKNAKNPLIIVGSGITDREDAGAFFSTIGKFVESTPSVLNENWNGYNVLQRSASRAGAYDIGFTPSDEASKTTPKMVWLLGADEVSASDIPADAFVVYQGHNGDVGAQFADVVLPGAAYTEKAGTYVNTEGRSQISRAATGPPGGAREDWKILRAVSEYLGVALPYEDAYEVRDRLAEISPSLVRYDLVEPTVFGDVAVQHSLVGPNGSVAPSSAPLTETIENFYMTDSISRSSPTMAKSSIAFNKDNKKNQAFA